MTTAEIIGKNLSLFMSEKGMNLAEIIDVTGITRPTLTKFLKQRSEGIKWDTLEKLADFFDVPVNSFFTEINVISIDGNVQAITGETLEKINKLLEDK